MRVEISTVSDDEIVAHVDGRALRLGALTGGRVYEVSGLAVRTLSRPPGELLCRFATVNDLHFGELECGDLDGHRGSGGTLCAGPGEPPHPVMMNGAAAAEIAAIEPAAVIAKGDLTAGGRASEFAEFRACYAAFGPRLHVIRGNHDTYGGLTEYSGDAVLDLPGVRLVLLDTTFPGRHEGFLTREQLELVATAAAEADRPVMVFGHHHVELPGETYAAVAPGLAPADSRALVGLLASTPAILGYFAGHTHRNRAIRPPTARGAVFVEVACVKDFPGSWAEYRVYAGGVMQVHRRISSPAALAWSERCRSLYAAAGVDYAAYAFQRSEDRCFTLTPR